MSDEVQNSAEENLALYAMTGTLSKTFYSSTEMHIPMVMRMCEKCSPEYVAKVAVMSKRSHMREMPALLLAYLHKVSLPNLRQVFDKVVTNGQILKKFVRYVRSNVTGRKNLGYATRMLIRQWLAKRTYKQLMQDNVGDEGNITMRYILRIVRPKPRNQTESAMYAWLCGGGNNENNTFQYRSSRKKDVLKYDVSELPSLLRQWESYRRNPAENTLPDVPYAMATSHRLTEREWCQLARRMSYQELRSNLNALNAHGVFKSDDMIRYVSERLSNKDEIRKANLLPYQLLAAHISTKPVPQGLGPARGFWDTYRFSDKSKSCVPQTPAAITNALGNACEVATENVPVFKGNIGLMIDKSGSMTFPISGERVYNHYSKVQPSKVRCIDVAALMACSILRKNPGALILPFSTKVFPITLNPLDSVFRNTERLMEMAGGNTDCSSPIAYVNEQKIPLDLLIIMSDYESWSDERADKHAQMMAHWRKYKSTHPNAKLVCVDLTPRVKARVIDHPDVLAVGGWSDKVFAMIDMFARGELGNIVECVNKIELDGQQNDTELLQEVLL